MAMSNGPSEDAAAVSLAGLALCPCVQEYYTRPSLKPPPDSETNNVSIRCIDLYRAAKSGTWTVVEEIARVKPDWLRTRITKKGDTVLHVATASNHLRFVEMVIKQDPFSLFYINDDGKTPFHLAAASGVVNIAKAMLKVNSSHLPYFRTNHAHHDMTPLFMAVQLGHEDMVRYLLDVTTVDKYLTANDRIEILTSSISTGLYDVALHVLNKDLSLAYSRDSKKETALHALCRKPSTKASDYVPSIWKIVSSRWSSQRNFKAKSTTAVTELTETVWKEIIQQNDTKVIYDVVRSPWESLFSAIWWGNLQFITTLIQYYPDLVLEENKEKHNIFQVAIIARQPEIFNLVYEFGDAKELLATYKDDKDNNMLHIVSRLPPPHLLSRVSGAALQMQRELQWFEAVKKIVRRDYPQNENQDLEKPDFLFSKQHEGLRRQGEEWMKKTAESCALVAALIATMVFATAYQLPGGVNGSNGSPVLLKSNSFIVYAISNAVSLFTSTASILMFLSILTSRYAERDFLESLPIKLMIGLSFLLISMGAMIVSFTTTLFITFHDGPAWPPILVALFASLPILLFSLQHFPLLTEMYYSTYVFPKMFLSGGIKLFNSPSQITTLATAPSGNNFV